MILSGAIGESDHCYILSKHKRIKTISKGGNESSRLLMQYTSNGKILQSRAKPGAEVNT